MQPLWMNLSAPNDQLPQGAIFVGSVGNADIWVSRVKGNIICQYEDADEWLTYAGGGGLAHAVRNAKAAYNANQVWTGDSTLEHMEVYYGHNHKAICQYLLCFAPWVFSDTTRAELLAAQGISVTTNQQGETT